MLRIYILQDYIVNAVCRDMLYTALFNKRILTADEARFLERLHDCLYFRVGTNQRYHFRNGVHQGLLIMNCSLTYIWKTLLGRYA